MAGVIAKERVELDLGPQTCKATLFLGGHYITQVTVGCANGPWNSGTEGVIAALERLTEHMRHETRHLGIPMKR